VIVEKTSNYIGADIIIRQFAGHCSSESHSLQAGVDLQADAVKRTLVLEIVGDGTLLGQN